MRTTLLLLVLLTGPALASQTVWKWVDESGVTHYSDRAVPGATKLEVSGRSSAYKSPDPSGFAPPSDSQPQEEGPQYRDFEIWQPSDGETIPNTGGNVSVNIRLDPGLQNGHSLFLYMDNRLIEGYPGNTLSFDLQEVPRGTHSLIAVINDASGLRVQESPRVSFTVRQASIAQPPVGPALRPPAKPQPRPRS